MRINHESLRDARFCIIDTGDMMNVGRSTSPDVRCRYVESMLAEMDYPIEVLPWEYDKINNGYRLTIDESDLRQFFTELSSCLRKLHYEGEPLLVSPSKGTLVILHFFKERS